MIVGRRVVHLAQVTSTMDEIENLAAAGEPEGAVVLADEQSAGRGRGGRSWRAPAGTAILCSVLLRPNVTPDRLTPLPLIAGVAVAEAIEAITPVQCRLKWPNDVWIAGAKVAGILLTTRATASGIAHVNLGIGINVNVPPDSVPAGGTSLLAATGAPVDRQALFIHMLASLDATYASFRREGPQLGLAAWRERAALLDELVVVATADGDVSGRLIGVDADGALLLADGDAVQRVVAGDLTRGPRHAPDANQ